MTPAQMDCVAFGDVSKFDVSCTESSVFADVQVVDGEIVSAYCFEDYQDEIFLDDLMPASVDGKFLTGDRIAVGPGKYEGDVNINANAVVFRGAGVEETEISGMVTISGNSSGLLNVTIVGDVTIEADANGNILSDCLIRGDLVIESNNFKLVNCDVFGDVTVDGNNAGFFDVQVSGNVIETRPLKLCFEAFESSDDDGDLSLSQNENVASFCD